MMTATEAREQIVGPGRAFQVEGQSKHATIETLLRVWDGFGYDDGDVMRNSVRALLEAAYSSGTLDS